MLVNREGRRFCDETAPYGIMDGLIQEQGDSAFAIFDQVALDEATAAGVARYKQPIPGSTKKQSPHWNADVVEAMVRSGRGAPSRHDRRARRLARRFRQTTSQATVDRVQRVRRRGRGRRLPQGPEVPRAASPSGPFYGAEVRPATVCFTACGLRIDRDAQRARRGRDAGVPGLFAAGEGTGGVVGPRYVGSGNSYANCVDVRPHRRGDREPRTAAGH